MTETILDEIIAVTGSRLSLLTEDERETTRLHARDLRSAAEPFRLSKALSINGRINVIAEIKRASPSKGIINDRIDVSETAQIYQRGGACAISVLTEETYFMGSITDLKSVRAIVDIPLLRKDFIVDEYQIYEAAAAGADAVLLIIAALPLKKLRRFFGLTQVLGLDALVEVHTAEELDVASQIGAKLIGVNNRDLRTFNVSIDVSRRLIKRRPADVLMIAESGISARREIDELRSLGYDGFLVGESLMRSGSASRIEEFASSISI